MRVLTYRRDSISTKLSCEVTITAGTITQEGIPLQVDTGATCFLIDLQSAKQLFKGTSFEPSTGKLYGFGYNALQNDGKQKNNCKTPENLSNIGLSFLRSVKQAQ